MSQRSCSKSAIIVGGGLGKRYDSSLPKQFTYLGNKTIAEHTVDTFYKIVDTVVLVVPETHLNLSREIFTKYDDIIFCTGGKTRQESVLNGLLVLQDKFPDLVAIHDIVRPMVSPLLIKESFRVAEINGSALPTLLISDSLWQKNNSQQHPVDRSAFLTAQTPQTFLYQEILRAHLKCGDRLEQFTDCASVYYHMFKKIRSFCGDKQNIKLTTKEDLEWLKFLIDKKSKID